MLDLAHFLHLLSFTAGIVALVIVHGIARQAGQRHIWSYIAVLLCINLISAAHSFESFIKIKNSLAVNTVGMDVQLDVLLVLLSAVRLALAYQFLSFAGRLTRSAPGRMFHVGFLGLIAVNALLQTVAVAGGGLRAGAYLSLSAAACHVLLFLAFLWGSARVWAFSRRAGPGVATRWLHAYAVFWLTYGVLVFANRGAGEFHLVSLNLQLLIFGAITLILNGVHVFFSSRFFAEHLRDLGTAATAGFEELLKRYDITRREADIIRQVCEGKTNKEIAAALFITPNTVRDHTSNIYQKTGVRNRTQLARLFG